MDMRIRGKRAFVSGSTQGIGFAIASALAREGARVIVHGRAQAGVDAAIARLHDIVPGADLSGIAADVTAPGALTPLTDALDDADILVNNVGAFELQDFTDITDDQWHSFLDVNLMSGVRLTRAALPGMLERGTGRVIFVASEAGVNVPADMIHYGVAKAGVIALANGVSKLTRGTAVTVNTILGGPTYSDGVAAAVASIARAQNVPEDAMKAAIIGANTTTLLGRFIAPEEIAALVTYLASPLSSATNGAALRADGGVLTAAL